MPGLERVTCGADTVYSGQGSDPDPTNEDMLDPDKNPDPT